VPGLVSGSIINLKVVKVAVRGNAFSYYVSSSGSVWGSGILCVQLESANLKELPFVCEFVITTSSPPFQNYQRLCCNLELLGFLLLYNNSKLRMTPRHQFLSLT
jgi:hypothetical protein